MRAATFKRIATGHVDKIGDIVDQLIKPGETEDSSQPVLIRQKLKELQMAVDGITDEDMGYKSG